MPRQALSLETLHLLDHGRGGMIANAAIRAALADLDDRGGDDGKPRQVVLTLTLQKLDSGALASHLDAKWRGPAYRTGGTVAALRQGKHGEVIAEFQPLAPDNPAQETLEFPDGEVRED